MSNINEIRINGKIEIDEPINPDTEYSIALKRIQNDQGKVSKYINKNDEEVFCWSMINLDIVTIIGGDKMILGKPKRGSMSQVLRMKIEDLYDNQYAGSEKYKDKEDFYKKYMSKIIDQVNETA